WKRKQKISLPEKQWRDLFHGKKEIELEDFQALDLRVGFVLEAEPVPNSSNLLKLKCDIGEERRIVAGIGASYAPSHLIGKKVIILANLKPAKLMGVLSEGMMLAATDKKRCFVPFIEGDVQPGTKVC
ncbi:MAG: methionine--tRNA ligase subunit beta, partial [Desulfobacterales bacterium]|nr:methionine--tRNA ligase subunit beta [Desulfobacterales bacterium]